MSNWTEDDHMTPEQEREVWESEAQQRVARDAARWRISQIVYPRSMSNPLGYFAVEDDGIVRVGIQPHPVTGSPSLSACILGKGQTEGEAIDQMFLALDAIATTAALPSEIEAPRLLRFEGANNGTV
jgi:hypothetical protein